MGAGPFDDGVPPIDRCTAITARSDGGVTELTKSHGRLAVATVEGRSVRGNDAQYDECKS